MAAMGRKRNPIELDPGQHCLKTLEIAVVDSTPRSELYYLRAAVRSDVRCNSLPAADLLAKRAQR